MSRPTFEQRIARAGLLADRHPSAGQVLHFYQRLAAEQQRLCDAFASGAQLEAERERLMEFLERERPLLAEDDEFVERVLEGSRDETLSPGDGHPDNECPCCGGEPVAAIFVPEFDGLRRRLVCSRCAWEWDFRRIQCPACGETDFEKLPAYQAEAFGHIRVDTCESCKTYLLTIDLSRENGAIAVVDDLAAIPLHFWATDQGYHRIETNLLGL